MDAPFPVKACKPIIEIVDVLFEALWSLKQESLPKQTSKIKSTIRLLGLRRSCRKRTLRTSPSRASRTALQIQILWQKSSRPGSLQEVQVSFGVRIQQLSLLSTHEMHRLDCVAASPLLGFIQELSEDRPSEVVGQSAGHVVSDEAFDDGLPEGEFLTSILHEFYTAKYSDISHLQQVSINIIKDG